MAAEQLLDASLRELRPTQMTVGFLEVAEKKKKLGAMKAVSREDFIGAHWFPAIKGPQAFYIVDHHHLGLALLELDITRVRLLLLGDLSALEMDEFWLMMEHRQWVHPYDAHGLRCALATLPASLSEMVDDPYRSLAGEVRRAGGFANEPQPFIEFLWADFFRRRLPLALLANDPKNACRQALALAHSPRAAHLPGWCGTHE